MGELTATDAARRFADLLDAVEHRGETFLITRRGRAVARIEPAVTASGAALKRLMRDHRPDPEWLEDLARVREQAPLEDRRWPG